MGMLVDLISVAKDIPESHLQEALEMMRELKKKADLEQKEELESGCPHCGSHSVVRNGQKCHKQNA